MIIDVKSSKLTWSARSPQTATSETFFIQMFMGVFNVS